MAAVERNVRKGMGIVYHGWEDQCVASSRHIRARNGLSLCVAGGVASDCDD